MEKAIDIKRRAQRCIQNGDLDGALKEYEKLIAIQDSDPYNFVLLADLLYKKGDMPGAAQRYIASIDSYEKATLYKNAIAVGKKMMRLSLSPTLVLQKLAGLHALDGLGTEAALYYQQYAEHLMRDNRTTEAADALRKAFEASPENIKALERLAEVYILDGENESAARTLGEAAVHYQSGGLLQDADRCRVRASTVNNGVVPAPAAIPVARPVSAGIEPGVVDLDSGTELAITESHRSSVSKDETETGAVAASDAVAEPEAVTASAADVPFELDAPYAPSGNGETSRVSPLEGGITHTMDLGSDGDVRTGPPSLSTSGDGPELEPSAPGIRFEIPADEPVAEPAPAAEAPAEPVVADAAADEDSPTVVVERLLREAREHFRNGEREAAGTSLVQAARLYDDLGQHDSAATIYRNLARSTHATPEAMTLWLRNCESRNDRVEAAQVACELGDRAFNDGDMDAARDWFRRANGFDSGNETAKRRLQKLNEGRGTAVTTASPGAAPDAPESGRVEVAVGRSEAVTFDLGSLVSEFQRGVETQISGDPQGHYDLAMAYREMGLLEQAIDSFRAAGRDASFAQRCAEMVGRSMLDQGRFDDAAQEFMVALELPGLSPDGACDLRFQLGLAHEAAGRVETALAEFERVYATLPSYPDVAQKIRLLRKALESS